METTENKVIIHLQWEKNKNKVNEWWRNIKSKSVKNLRVWIEEENV